MSQLNIKLLVMIRQYPNGLAITKKIKNLLHSLSSRNIDIFVISCRSNFPQSPSEGIENGIPYKNIGLKIKLYNLPKTILYFFEGLSLIVRHKRKNYSNILYSIGPINIESILFVFWAKLLGYKLVFDINEDYSVSEDKLKLSSRFKEWTTNRLDNITYSWADAIAVVSTHLRNKYLNKKLKKKPVVLIPVTAKENHNPDKNSFNDPLQVLYAGTFDLKDGIDDIIDGFRLFNTNYKNARLIMTGKNERQAKFKEKLHNFPNIIFKGYLSDEEFYNLLRNADVMCMCRTNSAFSNAGFPFKLGEYLATGNPVISTKASDVMNYLSPDDAYLIDSNDPEQICEALTSITSNPQEAWRIGRNGFVKYQNNFSPERNGELLYELFCNVSKDQVSIL